MQIIHIIPGSGGSFYCGNCLRDSKYVHALRSMQHDVVKIPMYLPLFADEHDLNDIPVFYGAISIYLKQLWPALRRAPSWLNRMLDSKPALKVASRMAGSTRAAGLEEMTVSMLLGEDGGQEGELNHLVDWIGRYCRPDIIHLSNALLLGLAHRIREKLNVPVICSLQDEDTWVDVMRPEAQREVWGLMSRKASHVDAFLSVSDHYTRLMRERLNLPQDKVWSLHLGVEPLDYEFTPAPRKPGNIGFLSRMSRDNGLDILVDAFIELKKAPEAADTQLVISGGYTRDDAGFVKAQKRKLRRAGLLHQVDFHEDFEGEGRKAFFRKVAVLSVPVRNGEAFGLYLLEALASGTPVVQPRLGAFPEIIATSGGGITYEPNRPERLAAALKEVLFGPQQLARLSENGRQGIERHFHLNEQASKMIGIYEHVIKGKVTEAVSK
ncbi:MAG: glycosyltransferase family 4 protein [Phaeodactylibacter sp.]|nr:glycosyltransferase family 4 protein [Phaeodactylibacter sp.]